MLLTPAEVADLTGLQRPSAQARWLRERRYPFEIGADGRIKILRSAVEARLGAPATKPREPALRLA